MSALEKLKNFMNDKRMDQIYISSFDKYLGEYVPKKDNLRYYLTDFTGSTAEALIKAKGKSHLFVDGRYTEQADKEVDKSLFQVHTCGNGQTPFTHMMEFVDKGKELFYIPERTSYSGLKSLEEKFQLCPCEGSIVEGLVGHNYKPKLSPITWVSPELGGVEFERKKERFQFKAGEAYFVSALDNLAWITNGRGYHMPYQSTFLGSALVSEKGCHVFIDKDMELSNDWEKIPSISWIRFETLSDYQEKLKATLLDWQISYLSFDPQSLNASDFDFFKDLDFLEKLEPVEMLVTRFQSIKFPEEIHIMQDDFIRGSRAVYNTIKTMKESWEGKTELDLYNETSRGYKTEGALAQSFHTIAGFGPNGSIIHYGASSDKVPLVEGELVLVDSGGYFESGFATDKTRTFILGDAPSKPLYREIYTLVLKGLLNLQFSEFDEGTTGGELDAITRAPLKERGYDYAHGTGHGVGINVHEGGVRIHSTSTLPMKENQVVSLEPGIYIPGVGGVRLENIAQVVKDEKTGKLRFKNLVFIGFEKNLIDRSLLNSEEKKWLFQYEKECEEKGLSF